MKNQHAHTEGQVPQTDIQLDHIQRRQSIDNVEAIILSTKPDGTHEVDEANNGSDIIKVRSTFRLTMIMVAIYVSAISPLQNLSDVTT
jgi:hypothetical protein